MPYKWDPASERNLLLFAISNLGTPSTAIWDQVAQMIEPGGTLNGNGCSQKFYKLKKESDKLLAEGMGAVISTDPATPATKTLGSRGAGGRKRKNADIDADGDTATPSKRRASAKKKKAAPEPDIKAQTQEPEAEAETEEASTVKAEETVNAEAD